MTRKVRLAAARVRGERGPHGDPARLARAKEEGRAILAQARRAHERLVPKAEIAAWCQNGGWRILPAAEAALAQAIEELEAVLEEGR